MHFKINTITWIMLFVVLSSFFSKTVAESAVPAREYIKELITRYLNAMVTHTPDSLPLAADVRFTEDCTEMKLGEGLWKTISDLTDYRMDFIDVRQGVSVSYCVVKENGSSILFALRLKVVDKKISEIETMVVKNSNEGMIFNIKAFTTPSDAMTDAPDIAVLNTREAMATIAKAYPEGLKVGSFKESKLQATDDAYRFENGQLMAGPGCTFFTGCEHLRTQTLPTLSGIIYQVAAIDEELGVVVLRMNFGPGSVMGDNSSDLDVFESFKIYNDSIHAVEAFMQKVPKGTDFGWEYDATPIAGLSPAATGHTPGQITVTTKGVSIPMVNHTDNILFSMYTSSGRLVYTKNIPQFQQNNPVFVPLHKIPTGYYIGRVQYCAGNETVTSSVFNMKITK